jgi:HK97 family phage prohead protease
MPYFIESDNPDCSGWATVKDDGEVMGCHLTKGDAIDQMVALSLAEDIEPGGERGTRAEPGDLSEGDFVEWDSSGGMARGQIEHIMTEGTLGIPDSDFSINATPEDPAALIRIFRPYEDGWEPTETLVGHRFSTLTKIDPLPMPTEDDDDDRSEARQVDLDVPAYIRDAASRGLELRAEGFGGDGLTDGTIREARDMADGQITEDKVVRANAWAARHAVDLDAPSNTNPDDDGWPGAGAVAHYLWGIDPLNPEPARNWFERKAAEIQEERTMGTATITRSTENQVRQLAFDVAPNEDGLTLDGYGAVFNEWTVIEDDYGQYRERIMPGAFRRTLGQRMPILQFDHGTHPLIGSIPLGRITQITEDNHGLRVKARLSDNWLVQPVRDAIRDGGITGMSFRFRIVNEKWGRGSDGMEERSISEVALYEVGPVVFPAYEQTSVGVRSRHVLRALEDAEIRDEIARIMASGTDLRSLATDIDDDPDTVHSSDEPSTIGHGSIPTRTQRIARMRLAGIIKE